MAKLKKGRKAYVNSSPVYTGTLAEPVYQTAVGLLGGDSIMRRHAEKQVAEKLPELFRWYGIDQTSSQRWIQLAVALAVAHVPGMQITDKRSKSPGPAKKWAVGGELSRSLIQDVDSLRAAARAQGRKMTNSKAITALCDDKRSRWYNYSSENLVVRHREARRLQRDLARRLTLDPKSLVSEALRLEAASPKNDEDT